MSRASAPTTYIIDTSHGPIVDQAALIDALAAAGHPFRGLDNVILTPHVDCVVEQNHQIIDPDALEDVEAFLVGKLLRPPNTVAK